MPTPTHSSIQDPSPLDRRPIHRDRWRRTARGPLGLVIAILTLGTCLVAAGQQPATAAPAYRLEDFQYRRVITESNSEAVKHATALCPEGTVVVGGTVEIIESATPDLVGHITLTRMVPYRAGETYGYAVTAAETPPGTNERWALQAWAMCTKRPPGYRIVNGVTAWSSSTVKKTAAGCDGQVALGAGAMVTTEDFTPHGVGLQVVRASGTGDITRAQATEPAGGGYSGRWKLGAYAVCADRPDGYEVRYSESDRATGQSRTAEAVCSGNGTMLNAGATVGDAPPNVTIYATILGGGGNWTQVRAYENTPTLSFWTVAGQVICALT